MLEQLKPLVWKACSLENDFYGFSFFEVKWTVLFSLSNDEDTVSLTRSQSTGEKPPQLSFKQLQEGDSGFNNPAYGTAPNTGNTNEESQVKEALPTYADVTEPVKAPIPQDSEYQTVDELHVQEEEKEDLGALEKQKEKKQSEPAEDDPKQANFKAYQRMDDIWSNIF